LLLTDGCVPRGAFVGVLELGPIGRDEASVVLARSEVHAHFNARWEHVILQADLP
jgi:hypothetical protein